MMGFVNAVLIEIYIYHSKDRQSFLKTLLVSITCLIKIMNHNILSVLINFHLKLLEIVNHAVI